MKLTRNESVREIRRAYYVDELEQVRRVPRPVYDRLVRGDEALPVFATRPVRFIDAVFGLTATGEIAYARAFFPVVHFDGTGRRDRRAQDDELALAERESSCSQAGEWAELYRAQRYELYRWQPSQTILSRLREKLPHAHQR